MKRIVVSDTELYKSYNAYTAPSDMIKTGVIIELGNVVKDDYEKEWIEVLSNSKNIGYIKGETMLLDPEKYCYIAEDYANAYQEPDTKSPLVRTYKKNEEIFLIDKTSNGKLWYKVFDIQGNTGYIQGTTYLKSTNVNGQIMILSEDHVKLYQTNDTEAPILCSMEVGSRITLLSIVKDPWGNRWFYIETSHGNGYIKGNTEMFSMDEYAEMGKDLRKTPHHSYFQCNKWLFAGFALILISLIWLACGYLLSSEIYYYPFILIGISIPVIIKHSISASRRKKCS